MLNIVSILFGLLAIPFALAGLIPFFNLLNWVAIPIALGGVVIGVLSRRTSGRNLNIVVLVVAFIRLALGGGIF